LDGAGVLAELGGLAEAVVDVGLAAATLVADVVSGVLSCRVPDEVAAGFVAQATSANDWTRHRV
jgi:hypothetical protein